MAAATRCITNSITLEPGTSFVPPPGSTIIGASNISNILSTCVDLTKIEQTECYVVMLASLNGNSNGHSEYFESGQQKVIGVQVNGVYTSFGDGNIFNVFDNGHYDMNLVYSRLAQYVSGISFGNTSNFTANGANLSDRSALAIKTIPSIGNNLQLVLEAIANVSPGGGASTVRFYANFAKYTDLATAGIAGLPTCP